MEVVHSEYISPCSPIVLKRWGHEAKQDPEGTHEAHFVKHIFKRLPTDLRNTRAPENLEPVPVPTTPITAAVTLAASVAAAASEISLPAAAAALAVNNNNSVPSAERDFDNPYHKSCRFPKLFGDFPRTLIVCGDAERLVREVRSLVAAMEKDGTDLSVHWARDACHDPLMLSEFWWDRAVLEEIWHAVGEWAVGFDAEGRSESMPSSSFDAAPGRIGFTEG